VQFLGAIRVDLVRFSPILVAALFLFVALGFVQFFGTGQSSLPSVSVLSCVGLGSSGSAIHAGCSSAVHALQQCSPLAL
jgi:hypothetical protein